MDSQTKCSHLERSKICRLYHQGEARRILFESKSYIGCNRFPCILDGANPRAEQDVNTWLKRFDEGITDTARRRVTCDLASFTIAEPGKDQDDSNQRGNLFSYQLVECLDSRLRAVSRDY